MSGGGGLPCRGVAGGSIIVFASLIAAVFWTLGMTTNSMPCGSSEGGSAAGLFWGFCNPGLFTGGIFILFFLILIFEKGALAKVDGSKKYSYTSLLTLREPRVQSVFRF